MKNLKKKVNETTKKTKQSYQFRTIVQFVFVGLLSFFFLNKKKQYLYSNSETLDTFFTFENKNHCEILQFNIKFTKFKTFYQKSVILLFSESLKFLKKNVFLIFDES